ncbi:acyltransferase family protein [Flavobacterium aquidurense]|uniref:acyltransferase family protein n=1 Tax=Flavobacterium aquidurense TaxID=362413 RepID=UPI003756A597
MTKERLISLDVFRGFTILLMTIVNNPGSWASIYPPLEHAEWHGCTPTDLVFPFFVFIMGTAIPFAMPTKHFDSVVFNKIIVRSLRIFCLGFFLAFFGRFELFGLEGIPLLIIRLLITFAVAYALLGNFTLKIKTYLVLGILAILLFLAYSKIEAYEDVRIPGVLQRIGIVYFFASLLYLKTNLKTQFIVAASILVLYWVLMAFVPVPGFGPANFEKGTNLAAWLDNVLLNGHLWSVSKTWDPEGILSTLPAIGTGILGMWIGQILNLQINKIEIVKKLAITGIALVLTGLLWNIIFPINKSLWTSSYVLYTAGIATICLTILYYIIDIANYKKWTKLFLIWGVNPMIVFFFSGIIPRVMSYIKVQSPEIATEQINLQTLIYKYGIATWFENPLNSSVAYAIIYAIFWSCILWVFYKKKLIFKV